MNDKAPRCPLCGDASLTTEAARRLEVIVESARESRQEVSITRWREPWGIRI